MSPKLTAATTLATLRKEAKRWLKALREHDVQAGRRFDAAYPKGPDQPVLRDVQHALAREYAFASWTQLKQALATRPSADGATPRKPEDYERAAQDFVSAFDRRLGARHG